MNRFEKHIDEVARQISVQKQDRAAYARAFDDIRDYLLGYMKAVDPVFKKIYGGPSLFGSAIEKHNINLPDEFDVHFLLKLPFHEEIQLRADRRRPGFINLNISEVLRLMRGDPNLYFVYEKFKDFVNNGGYLKRTAIQNWIEDVIDDALEEFGKTVKSSCDVIYTLTYLRRGTAHTIKAYSKERSLSIDFVPAFKFNADEKWLAQRKLPRNLQEMIWFAVPKPTVGPKKRREFTFSICAPQIEKHILENKQNLKPSLRLLKSLRDRMTGCRLKSYFIKSTYLLENDIQPDEFWQQSAALILIHMVDVILKYLDEGFLPFYWNEKINLLDGLTDDQISNIEEQFEYARKILNSYYPQPLIQFQTVRRLFGKGFDPTKSALSKEY